MRFYCPKCDLKYHVEGDKLASQRNAQMRCKACHTVFNVQAAIRVAKERSADGRPPLDGAPNLSSPPPKPAPMAWKSTMPHVSNPPGKGVVTMPLLDVTAKARVNSAKQVTKPGAVLTKPVLAPAYHGASVAPKSGRRGRGVSSLLASKSLRSAGERSNPPPVGLTQERAVNGATEPPVRVSRRGSAGDMPPIAEDRTYPAVPPLPRSTRGKSLGGSTLASAIEQPSTVLTEVEDAMLDLDSELSLIEPDAPDSPRLGKANKAQLNVIEAEATRSQLQLQFEPPDDAAATPLSPRIVAERSADGYEITLHEPTTQKAPSPSQAQAPVFDAFRRGPTASATLVLDTDLSMPETKPGVSFGIVVAVALLFGLGGLGVGYLLGSHNERAVTLHTSALPEPQFLIRAQEPPPPPPSEEAVDNDNRPASDAVGKEDKARSANEVRASNAQTVESANAVSLSDGSGARLSALTSPIAGKAAPASDPAQSAGDTGGLSAQAIQSTVARFQPGIRRTCWQPAMNRRGSAAGVGARVGTTVTIAPTGKVLAVSHDGEQAGYPGLAACISARVKGWKFPRAAASTKANIPFVFAAQ